MPVVAPGARAHGRTVVFLVAVLGLIFASVLVSGAGAAGTGA